MFALALAEDVELVLLEERDAEELYALVDRYREDLRRFLPWAGDTTLQSEREFIRGALEAFARGQGFRGGLRVAGELAGGLGVVNLRADVRRIELGYWLAPPFRGRGLMTTAVGGLLRVLFEEQGFNRVEIRCDSRNLPSRRVAERLGFRHEGTLRASVPSTDGGLADLEVFGLMRAEWQAWQKTQGARRRESGRGREWSA